MSTPNRPIRNLLSAIGLVLVLAATVAVVATMRSPDGPAADLSLSTIDSLAINAILEGTVEKAPTGSRWNTHQEWTVRIDTVLYDRGRYMSNAYGKEMQQSVPLLGKTISILVPNSVDLKINQVYAFYASRALFLEPEEQAKWPWQSDLVMVSGDGYRLADGTSEELKWSLNQITSDTESPLESSIAFASEYASFLDESNRGGDPALGPRLQALMGSG